MDDFLRDAPPELIDALLSANSVDLENQLMQARYKDAQGKEATEQPGLIHGQRGMTYAPSPIANIAAALRQGIGGRESEAALQQMQANWLRKGSALKALLAHQKNVEEGQRAKTQAGIMSELQQNAIPSAGYAGAATGSPMPSNLDSYFTAPQDFDFSRQAITGGGGGGGTPGQSGPMHDLSAPSGTNTTLDDILHRLRGPTTPIQPGGWGDAYPMRKW